MKNDLLLKALRREFTSQTPIWMMRQAGRYLPEYRASREKAGSFAKLYQTPELACEVALQPLERFGFDAAILFSDILTIPDALGFGVNFLEKEGPRFKKRIQTPEDVKTLGVIDPEDELRYVMDAVRLTHRVLNDQVPLIGFSGSPWTLAAYMIQGESSKDFALAKAFLYHHPEAMHQLLGVLTENVITYLKGQIAAGVDVVQIFDSWGGLLSAQTYRSHSLKYMTDIVQALKQAAPHIPIILFTKGSGLWLEEMANSGCDALSIDWQVSVSSAMDRVGHRVAIQGNLDPAVLQGDDSAIESEAIDIIDSVQGRNGHIFNLGHGLTPDIDPEKVAVLVDVVRRMSCRKK